MRPEEARAKWLLARWQKLATVTQIPALRAPRFSETLISEEGGWGWRIGGGGLAVGDWGWGSIRVVSVEVGEKGWEMERGTWR